MNTQEVRTPLLEVNEQNIKAAILKIKTMATRRGLVVSGEIRATVPSGFESKRARKRFQHRMRRVIVHPTMRASNSFLADLARRTESDRVTVDYSDWEKEIISARKAWKAALKTADEMRSKYLEKKGDFYRR